MSAHRMAKASRNRSQATPTPITIRPIWSPDSKKLLWSDRLQRLRYIDVASKAITQVDQDKFGEIQGYDWSPDSQWIVWARPEENDMPRIYLYSLANKQQTAVTDSWYRLGEAVFSDDGKYVLLSSARDFKPTFGDQEFANVYRDMQRVYLVTLAKETANPLAPKSDEVGKAEEKTTKGKSEGTRSEKAGRKSHWEEAGRKTKEASRCESGYRRNPEPDPWLGNYTGKLSQHPNAG